MKLPRSDALIVEQEKITAYLLNPAHRYGASKARFFAAFGFRAEEWKHSLRLFGNTVRTTQLPKPQRPGLARATKSRAS